MTFNEFDFNRFASTNPGWDSGRETLACNSGHLAEENHDEMIDNILLEPMALQGTLVVCGLMITLALIVLGFEFVLRCIVSHIRRKRIHYSILQILAYLWYSLMHRLLSSFLTLMKVWHFLCDH